MPSPRPLGEGVEKILVSPHEIPEDQILHLIILSCHHSKPGVCFLLRCFCFFFFLDCSSPGLTLFSLRTPLPFPLGCSAIMSEVSHFIAIVTLHLGEVAMPFSLYSVISIPWREGRFLILLIPWRWFIVHQSESCLGPQSRRCVHCIWIRYGWTQRCKEFCQVVWF